MSNLSKVFPLSASRPTLRLVPTNVKGCDASCAVAQLGVTALDAPAALNLHPHKSSLQLWKEKTGDISRPLSCTETKTNDETSAAYWNMLLEPLIAAVYTKRTGRRLRRVEVFQAHKTIPWMLASVKWKLMDTPRPELFECLSVSRDDVASWSEGVPVHLRWSITHMLAVTGAHAVDIAVLLGGAELRIFRMERDDELIEMLIEKETAFWRSVVTCEALPDHLNPGDPGRMNVPSSSPPVLGHARSARLAT